MTILCPGCGRACDEARLRGGRTIWCTCGSRVGAPRPDRGLAARPVRFLADGMLGGLARWLRLLGFDCSEATGDGDAELVRRAAGERRQLLTRDRGLVEEWRVANLHLVRGDDVRSQLADVLRRFSLAAEMRVLSRCARCNVPVEPAAAEDVGGQVPARVLERSREFHRCPSCARVYWEGTHAARIRRVAEELARLAAGEREDD